MPQYPGPVVFTDKTPKSTKQLEEMEAAYRKAFGKDLPSSVALAMNREKREKE